MPNSSPELTEVERRYWSKVEKTDGCWLWRGSIATGGYGKFYCHGNGKMAHRMAVELSGREIPDGLMVDHMCRVRHCVNPDHLRVVTAKVNTLENSFSMGAINKAKTHCAHGHEYSDENTYVRPTGQRECRICYRRTMRAWRLRQEQAA